MSEKIIALIPAAGLGERARTADFARAEHGPGPLGAGLDRGVTALTVAAIPKQYRLLKGEPMLRWAVKALLADDRIQQVRVAVAPRDERVAQALHGLPRTVWSPCGGPSRAATVMAALQEAQLDASDWVLVHDAARPGLPADDLKRLIDACLARRLGGLLARPVADTVKQSAVLPDFPEDYEDGGAEGTTDALFRSAPVVVQSTLVRERLWLAQTPQMFTATALLDALRVAARAGKPVTDEACALEMAGYKPQLISGSARNFKVTWPEDFDLMERWM